MGFPRLENWSRLPFPSPGDLSNPLIKPVSPALAGRFFTTEPPGKSKTCLRKTNLGHWLSHRVLSLVEFLRLWFFLLSLTHTIHVIIYGLLSHYCKTNKQYNKIKTEEQREKVTYPKLLIQLVCNRARVWNHVLSVSLKYFFHVSQHVHKKIKFFIILFSPFFFLFSRIPFGMVGLSYSCSILDFWAAESFPKLF